jgi:hypothetical protein
MPATAAKRRSPTALLIPLALALGALAIAVGPIGCSSEDASEAPAADQTEETTSRPVLLNLGVEDHTQERPFPDQFLIVTPGGNQWRPELATSGFATRAFEKYPVGEPKKLSVYSAGKEGPRLEVPFTMKADMSSVLASSRTNVLVYDDSLVVTGPAVPDEKVVLDRPPGDSGS